MIVPCLNEEDTITDTVNEVLGVAPRLPVDVKVLMVDDGSKDGTRDRMARLCQEDPRCELMVNPRNLGVGRSVRNAWERIPSGAWVMVLPGDNELMFANSIGNYMEARGSYDVILGYLHNAVIRTPSRRLASFAFGKVISTLYGFRWRYLNGLKMYRVEVFRGIPIEADGHAWMAELLAKAQLRDPSLRVGEVPFMSRGRARGTAKAVRPASVARAIREVVTGSRSVAQYRHQVIRGTIEEHARQASHAPRGRAS